MASVPWGKAPWAQPAAAAAELRAEGGPPLRLHPSVEGGEGLGELVEHVRRGTGSPGSVGEWELMAGIWGWTFWCSLVTIGDWADKSIA